jgi:hypothetical protein
LLDGDVFEFVAHPGGKISWETEEIEAGDLEEAAREKKEMRGRKRRAKRGADEERS